MENRLIIFQPVTYEKYRQILVNPTFSMIDLVREFASCGGFSFQTI